MISAFSWQNFIILCSSSFCTSRPNMPVTPGVPCLPTFAFQPPEMKGHLFCVLVLEGLVGLHRTIQLQLLQHYWSGCRIGLPWYWRLALEMDRDHFVIFDIASKYCISNSFACYDGYSISSKGFLHTVVDIMVIWVKFIIPVHLSLLIPKMSTFQFALIPGSYAILLFIASNLASITSCIHNWVLFLLWLHLFILSGVISPLISSSILGTYQPGEFIFQCTICLHFQTFHEVRKARTLKWFAIPKKRQCQIMLKLLHNYFHLTC